MTDTTITITARTKRTLRTALMLTCTYSAIASVLYLGISRVGAHFLATGHF